MTKWIVGLVLLILVVVVVVVFVITDAHGYGIAYYKYFNDGEGGNAAAYVEQIRTGRSEDYARTYARKIGEGKLYAHAYAEQISIGKSQDYARMFAQQIAIGESKDYSKGYVYFHITYLEALGVGSFNTDRFYYFARYYDRAIRAGKSEDYAKGYAHLVESGKSRDYARRYADALFVEGVGHREAREIASNPVEAANASSERAINAAVVLAIFSITDDTEADRRAASMLEMTDHIGRGDMDNDTVLGLLNDIAPEASISEREKAADRLASISDNRAGELTPQQSMQVGNELTRLITGHGIDAEQRTEAAREMVRLSQSGELNIDNASELMGTIAPEWSVSERKEALGYLAWQFAHGEWDADSTKRTAEEGYTLITGGEIRLEKRMEAGVEIVAEGLKRYGGDSYDDESVDKATDLIKGAISGNLNIDSVSKTLDIDSDKSSTQPSAKDYYIDFEYYNWKTGQFSLPPAYMRAYTEQLDREQSQSYAWYYARNIEAGRSNTYARAYADAISNIDLSAYASKSDLDQLHRYLGVTNPLQHFERKYRVFFARAYAQQIDAGTPKSYAELYAFAYTGKIIAGTLDEYAEVYAAAYASEYTEQIKAGKSRTEAREYAQQIAAGTFQEYRKEYPYNIVIQNP